MERIPKGVEIRMKGFKAEQDPAKTPAVEKDEENERVTAAELRAVRVIDSAMNREPNTRLNAEIVGEMMKNGERVPMRGEDGQEHSAEVLEMGEDGVVELAYNKDGELVVETQVASMTESAERAKESLEQGETGMVNDLKKSASNFTKKFTSFFNRTSEKPIDEDAWFEAGDMADTINQSSSLDNLTKGLKELYQGFAKEGAASKIMVGVAEVVGKDMIWDTMKDTGSAISSAIKMISGYEKQPNFAAELKTAEKDLAAAQEKARVAHEKMQREIAAAEQEARIAKSQSYIDQIFAKMGLAEDYDVSGKEEKAKKETQVVDRRLERQKVALGKSLVEREKMKLEQKKNGGLLERLTALNKKIESQGTRISMEVADREAVKAAMDLERGISDLDDLQEAIGY